MDSRKTDKPRTEVLTLKLSEVEMAALKALAETHHRRPSDQLRHLLAEALKQEAPRG